MPLEVASCLGQGEHFNRGQGLSSTGKVVWTLRCPEASRTLGSLSFCERSPLHKPRAGGGKRSPVSVLRPSAVRPCRNIWLPGEGRPAGSTWLSGEDSRASPRWQGSREVCATHSSKGDTFRGAIPHYSCRRAVGPGTAGLATWHGAPRPEEVVSGWRSCIHTRLAISFLSVVL